MQSMNVTDEHYALHGPPFWCKHDVTTKRLKAATRVIQRGSPLAGTIGHAIAGTTYKAKGSFPEFEHELAAAGAEASKSRAWYSGTRLAFAETLGHRGARAQKAGR